jgi:hypothetical protein
VRAWTVDSDPKTGRYTHSLRAGGHALLAPIAVSVFQDLRVSASNYDGSLWWSLFAQPNLTHFEVAHHRDSER